MPAARHSCALSTRYLLAYMHQQASIQALEQRKARAVRQLIAVYYSSLQAGSLADKQMHKLHSEMN